jgi:Tfp pilus assembly protein PilF
VCKALLALLLLPAAHAVPSSACATCHREIYDRYLATPMARTSGPVTRETPGAFAHAASGFRYRVTGASFEWARGDVHGSRELPFFVGSGATARSFVISDGGYLFEAPVTWYAAARKWDLAPNYDRYSYPFLTRPILPACLHCHATGIAPIAGTHNRYSDPPFAEAGIGCERCHGPGDRHVASAKAADIINPAKLPADRRDSICAQCHLSGDVRVMGAGTNWSTYRPGDRLADSVAVFIRGGQMTVTSHVEKLQQSRCKQASGDKLWCGTCHDPHGKPSASLRETCSGCHACKTRNTGNCTTCHMPKSTVVDAQHVVYTDHSIPRRPRPAGAPIATELVAFPGYSTDPRDLALAYAISAARQDRTAVERPRAQSMLEVALRDHPDDPELLLYLAEIYRNTGKPDQAIPLYQRAMRLDPAQLTASVGLGGILMERSQFADAIPLWEDALAKDAGLVLVRTNLAMAYWQSGDLQSAERHLRKAIELAPGLAAPADLLKKLPKK